MSQYHIRFRSDVVPMPKESSRLVYRKAENKQFRKGEHRRNDMISTSYRHDSVKHLKGEPIRPSLGNTGKYQSDRNIIMARNKAINDVSRRRSKSFSDLFEDAASCVKGLHLQPSGATRQQKNPADPSRKLSTQFRNISLNIPQKGNQDFHSTPRLVSKRR